MSDRPNLLFFHIENSSTGDWGCYGGGIPIGARTPNVDRFADEGLMLTNYNVEAQCTPSRSALMTGRHSTRTGCTSVLPGVGLASWEVTIADSLKEVGYRNAIYGKWHAGKEPGRLPTDHGFDYWYGILGTWDEAMWPEDKFFQRADHEPEHIIESTGAGHLSNVKVLDSDVRKDIDLEFLERSEQWMRSAVADDEPFFVYFNHSQTHFPTTPRDEYLDSSDGGEVADCIQMIDGDFQRLLDLLDELGVRENTIVVFAADNGRDTTFHAANNQNATGNWRGGYFSTYEGNNRTIGLVQWPGYLRTGASDEMFHIVDWYPTLMHLMGHADSLPTDRVLDGVDQSHFLAGNQDESNREHFLMFFDDQLVGMRYRNFKVLTHIVENGYSPIQKLAIPHIYNLTVNPDENTPYNYDHMHSWVLYKEFIPRVAEYMASLQGDAVPKGAPADYNPKQT
ncbi:MAG: sulfatase-like hydrolase/transferase [Acidimicrobiales bacterium]